MNPLAKKLRAIRNKHFPPKLEFGCEINSCGNVWKIIDGRWKKVDKEKEKYLIKNFGYGKNWHNKIGTSHYEPFTEVLGKPVSLEEILKMIRLKDNKKRSMFIGTDNDKRFIWIGVSPSENSIKYDLTRSPEGQDDETLKKIINLIK